MSIRQRQSGATLVVSLIMLVVLTLLVVSAIRSSTTNLSIAGNMQVQEEAAAAAQQAVEQVITTDFTSATLTTQSIPVTVGATTYNVSIPKPTCSNSVPLLSTDPSLSAADTSDQLCFEGLDTDIILDASGKPVPKQTKCNRQQWDIEADITDNVTGAKVTLHQGVARRTYSPTPCP